MSGLTILQTSGCTGCVNMNAQSLSAAHRSKSKTFQTLTIVNEVSPRHTVHKYTKENLKRLVVENFQSQRFITFVHDWTTRTRRLDAGQLQLGLEKRISHRQSTRTVAHTRHNTRTCLYGMSWPFNNIAVTVTSLPTEDDQHSCHFINITA